MNQVLQEAILDTVRYADLFQMPVTAVQIWRCLIVSVPQQSTKFYSLADVRLVLTTSAFLQQRLDTQWGYYFLSGQQQLVRERLQRHARAQDKWKIIRRAARFLWLAPFVAAIAGSGSLALDNTKDSSDLDLFVIVKKGRIWTARLFLLIMAQLTGRRRKYWDLLAPNKICLNHYVVDGDQPLKREVTNLYTAVQYTLHVPIMGSGQLAHFRRVNQPWMQTYVWAPSLPNAGHGHEIKLDSSLFAAKKFVEDFLLEPIGDGLEKLAEWVQRFTIERHQSFARSGRVIMDNSELAFHPDTKVPIILQRFSEQKEPLTL